MTLYLKVLFAPFPKKYAKCCRSGYLHRHLARYVRMRIVVLQRKILILKVEDRLHLGVNLHFRQSATVAAQLQLRLLQVVRVKMHIAKSVHKVTQAQARHLRHHHRQQGVRRNVERHTQKHICAALIQLATQLAVQHIKLKYRVARRQSHRVDVRHIPCAHNQSPRVGVCFYLLYQVRYLVYAPTARCGPAAPLVAIHRPQFAPLFGKGLVRSHTLRKSLDVFSGIFRTFLVGGKRPIIPNPHSVLAEVLDVGVPIQKPQQLMNDSFGK